MTFIALRKDGHQGAGIHRHTIHCDSPKPLTCFLLVLRSFGNPFAQSIKPAALKAS